MRPFLQISRLARTVLRPVLLPLLPYLICALAIWIGIATLRSYLTSYIAALPVTLAAPLGRIIANVPNPRILVPSSRQVYSLIALPSTLFRRWRAGGSSKLPSFELLSVSATQSANERAHHALDSCASCRPKGPTRSCSPVAIWEHSAAVKYSSALDDRDFLADRLAELGDLSRNVKDDIIGLNAQASTLSASFCESVARADRAAQV